MGVNNTIYRLTLLAFFILLTAPAVARGPILNTRITIAVMDQKISSVFKRLEMQGDFSFSYNSEHIPTDSLVSFEANEMPLEDILHHVLGSDIQLKESGRHVILIRPDSKGFDKPARKMNFVIKGFIRNKRTGAVISNASVYEIGGKSAVFTNKDGYYELQLDAPQSAFSSIAYSRKEFIDTVLVLRPDTNLNVDVTLLPYIEKLSPIERNNVTFVPSPTMDTLGWVKLMVNDNVLEQTGNLQHLQESKFAQASLVPSFGTDGGLSAITDYNLSFNLFSGYCNSINGFELGGLVNIVRSDLRGVQIGGIGNVLGGETHGAQLGGFFNYNLGSMRGFQMAGFSNVLHDTLAGVQFAGFSNVVFDEMQGVQIAGFSNVCSGDVDGAQFAGFSNVAIGDVNKVQISGFSNVARNVNAVQVSGFSNVATDTIRGAQIAGFNNYARSAKGGQVAGFANVVKEDVGKVQFAGFLNYARKVDGFQIGIFNFSDSIGRAPIGFFSHVNKGLHKAELGGGSLLHASVDYKTGVHRFYNIFSAGARFEQAGPIVAFGYGFGTEFTPNAFHFGFDLVGYRQETTDLTFDKNDYLVVFRINLSHSLGKRARLVWSPSFEMQITDRLNAESGEPMYPAAPYSIFSPSDDQFHIDGWVGGRLAIRF